MDDVDRRRGRLIVYLGSAPGVGKTYAALGEAQRRLARGTDVVVGFVETHDREQTAAQLEGLEVVPRKTVDYRGSTFPEMDVDAVLARQPAVAFVDELAHTNVPGSRHEKRAQDVEELLAAGIDVITTINIQHLESLNDEVERITGVRQQETVPDEVVRTADQIQLVDMSPEALRRRMAHGNIYKPEKVDASLTSYFRVGNLTALRELALLWLADRVDDQLDDYRRAHRIQETWPAKERIVVAVTGGPESETLIRRGARLAQRAAGAELLAVHVLATDGLRNTDERRLDRAQELVASVGGTFHSVVGEDVSAAVVDFAAGTNATMIIVGVSRHGRLRRLFTGTTGDRIASLAGSIDVHLVTHDQVARRALRRPLLSPLSRGRQVTGWVGAVALPMLLTWALHGFADTDQLPLAMLTLLASTVAVALIGGLLPALLGAVVGFLALNYFFTPPVGTLTVSEPRNLLALVVFLAVAAAVATVVDLASRRAADALRARAEATTLSGLSRSVLTGQDTAEAIVERLRETFGQDAVSLLARGPRGLDRAGVVRRPVRGHPRRGRHPGPGRRHARAGALRRAPARRATSGCWRRSRCRPGWCSSTAGSASATSGPRTSSAPRPPPRRCSGRSPTTSGRRWPPCAPPSTGCSPPASPRTTGTSWSRSVGESAEQLERLIDDLLDLSRLQSGLIHPVLRTRSLDEVLPLAVSGHEPDVVRLEVEEPAPLVTTDAGLLERVVANLVGNAVRHAPGSPVRVLAHVLPDTVEVIVVDRGPGIAARGSGAGVRAVPAARRHRHRRPRPRAGRRPGPHRGARRDPVGGGHPRRRADHGALAPPGRGP